MPERLLGRAWQDDHGPDSYPFSDGASLTAKTGLVIAQGVFLDACVQPPNAMPNMAITAVIVAPQSVTIQVGDPLVPVRASAVFNPLAAPTVIDLTTPDGRPAGVLVTAPGTLAEFQVWPTGTHPFAAGTAQFSAGVIVPNPQAAVAGILLGDGTILTGEVWIVGTGGVAVTTDDSGDVQVSAVGDPNATANACMADGLYQPATPIQTINGIPPDDRGYFELSVGTTAVPDPVLRIVPDSPATLRVYLSVQEAAQ